MKIYPIVLLLCIGFVTFSCKKGPDTLNLKVTTPSGHDYTLHKKGDGREVKYGEVAYFHVIEVMDDTIMTGNSYMSGNLRKIPILRPEENNQYGPLVDVLKELHIGDSITALFTFEGLRMPPGSPIFDHIQYDIKLMKLTTQRAFKAEQDSIKAAVEARYDAIKNTSPASVELLKENIKNWASLEKEITPGGVEYIIHEKGDGDVSVEGDTLPIYFIGAFPEGVIFDNSIEVGKPFWFIYGRGAVIPAWDEVFGYIPEGSKASMYVPFNLAYGIAGSPPRIPESKDLYFYVEVGLKDF